MLRSIYVVSGLLLQLLQSCTSSSTGKPVKAVKTEFVKAKEEEKPVVVKASLDTLLFDKLQRHMVHDTPDHRWPVKTAYPLPGAILPFKRVIAYYGNFYSKRMGILGALPPDEMLAKLQGEVKKWQKADTMMPVVPAIHYIVSVAQHDGGKDGKYRLRMSAVQIQKAIDLANKCNGIVILDVQIAQSTLQNELPVLEKYLVMPNVHLAIDPEFSMKTGRRPGTIIGTFDAADVNYASNYLGELVKKNNLPPKILIVHRFTNGMITNYKSIKTRPEVQIVMDMDGWGHPAKKVNSYKIAVVHEPVQFSGFKLFYKNDIQMEPHHMMTPEEVLKLYPMPVYVQYQ